MKKIFTLLTGIVFLIAILVAGGCKSANDQKSPNDLKKVTIYLRSIEINGEKHLSLCDLKGVPVIDSLKTDVDAGTIVIWRLERASGIKSISKIYRSTEKQKIFKTDPQKKLFSKKFQLIVPDDVKRGTKEYLEEYTIEYTDEENTNWKIDPFLRVPPVD
jgi:hypothetical protein